MLCVFRNKERCIKTERKSSSIRGWALLSCCVERELLAARTNPIRAENEDGLLPSRGKED